jgi:DNA-binding CsgD family transcriptional regulator
LSADWLPTTRTQLPSSNDRSVNFLIAPRLRYGRQSHSPVRAGTLSLPIQKISSLARNALADCQVVVILVDTEIGSPPHIAAMQMVFRLTDAEARLAAELAAGAPLEAAADRLGIAKETSRSQLKSIFAKAGCHRQAELVAILSTFLKTELRKNT